VSRSEYSDDCDDNWRFIMYRGAVKSAIKGQRGQAFLREAINVLENMEKKELTSNILSSEDGRYCLLGAVGKARGIDVDSMNDYGVDIVSDRFGISEAMTREIVFYNDEYSTGFETPSDRWNRMLDWMKSLIVKDSN